MHNFHIPVLGLSFSIDSPVKVAQYGISSVVSLSNDELIEDMRSHYSNEYGHNYSPITDKEEDYRAKRITGYLDLMKNIVDNQIEEIKTESLDEASNLTKYIDLLPENSQLKLWHQGYLETDDEGIKNVLNHLIRSGITAGSIDVNIMTKLNKANVDSNKNPLGPEYNDALAALRGFANSTLESSVVFSAGFNPRLYSYLEQFDDFFPNELGAIKKKVILKVSDYRSAVIQGKFLAKKGIWISEFRIESGLNCGGHAFPTEGLLLGDILNEFKDNRESLQLELFELCSAVWDKKEIATLNAVPNMDISVQGGIGTSEEQEFLLKHYNLQKTGWGTPFLLVPEATTVDDATIEKLAKAKSKDLYLSKTSPLGVPFNNLKSSQSEELRLSRIEKGKPGSPCIKKYLVSNTEFSKEPICTASRKYQDKKIKELDTKDLETEAYKEAYENIVVKACLCEDLSATAYTNYEMKPKISATAAICPGPNMAFFSRKYSLKEMVGHIYGNGPSLSSKSRPHVFINELKMYIDFLETEVQEFKNNFSTKQEKYLESFKANIEKGIKYYESISSEIKLPTFSTDLLGQASRLRLIGLVNVA